MVEGFLFGIDLILALILALVALAFLPAILTVLAGLLLSAAVLIVVYFIVINWSIGAKAAEPAQPLAAATTH